jgi:hypothetical protein
LCETDWEEWNHFSNFWQLKATILTQSSIFMAMNLGFSGTFFCQLPNSGWFFDAGSRVMAGGYCQIEAGDGTT